MEPENTGHTINIGEGTFDCECLRVIIEPHPDHRMMICKERTVTLS